VRRMSPYWRDYYGIGQPWTPRPAIRRGCMIALLTALAIVASGLIVALVAALT
jgi:hypothetical protein